MIGEILKSEVWMIGIKLPSPFPLGFGTLSILPRVFLVLTIQGETGQFRSIGEASIDFPFCHYDSWDVYYALSQLYLEGLNANSRLEILQEEESRKLLSTPAAFAALNMALDDAYGRLNRLPVVALYGITRLQGQALESISLKPDESSFIAAISDVLARGRIPKVKGGLGIEQDSARIAIAAKSADQFAVDFNATYDLDQFERLAEMLSQVPQLAERAIFFEQPTASDLGVIGLTESEHQIKQKLGLIPIMADESFVTLEDAISCQTHGILLNYKIQKVGGILVACEIEKSLPLQLPSMVGGTFPTAIGRVWDQHSLCVLKSAQLPSDGWQPSSDWFSDDKHFIAEPFSQLGNHSQAFTGFGSGIAVRWNLLESYRIEKPVEEYRAIRHNQAGKHIQIELLPDHTYSELYERLSKKQVDWNL